MAAAKTSQGDEVWKKMELGLIPDEELRRLIKIEVEKRIKWFTKPTEQEQLAQLLDVVKSLRGMPIGSDDDEAHNSKFYDTPRSFDILIAGRTIKETSGLYTDPTITMDEAAEKMMDLYCERADIKDGQTVLDLGCGCGPLVLHIAKKYKNCKVTGVTNIPSQKDFILEQCKIRNLSNVEIIIADFLEKDIEATYDRVFLISVIEHFKNFGLVLREISKWVKDDGGLLFLEHLCHKRFAFHAAPIDEDDWFGKYILPTGTLPSANTLLYFQDDITVVDHWVLNGLTTFGLTKEECLKNLDNNMEEIKYEFKSYYGIGEEETLKKINWWRVLFIIWEEMFKYNNGEDYMVAHLLFKKK
ncbi:hypothetical protein MKW98_018956 [Papaver atlanticum]|uniref:Uncharacterized protein n=1 Tax=Papaver atlanticum TaxID=357466 RepID=A0AAD4XXC2_9MAGN|nr:hypothetical protein MKW98_018956 [Papaver atlanticum]